MPKTSLLWHDYETFGIDARLDRPAQFAGVRTDVELNIIDDPVVAYCKPPIDYLPHPEACFLTGITPDFAEMQGVIEAEFSRIIHSQFSHPSTCSLGYNSIRFDDEFTRHIFYRNFYDPYAREWQNGNSRWDLIDVARAACALRPHGIQWPIDEVGVPIFKLEEITKANHISHEAAHDALSDVYATIALAKLIKQAQPKLFDFLWRSRVKHEAYNLLKFGSFTPVVHVSGRFPAHRYCTAVVLPICRHPENTNGIVVFDLSVDPEPLISLPIEEIRQRLFTATADLPEGVSRVPLKTVHLNKSPVLAPIAVLNAETIDRLQIDLTTCIRHAEIIKKQSEIAEKVAKVFLQQKPATEANDPELALYSGGFFSDRDRKIMFEITQKSAESLANFQPDFIDPRLSELFFRYRARNYPNTLDEAETKKWRKFCIQRLLHGEGGALSIKAFLKALDDISVDMVVKDQRFVDELRNYANAKFGVLSVESSEED